MSIVIDRYEHLDEQYLHHRNHHLRMLHDVDDHDHYGRILLYENQSDERLQHRHLWECRYEDVSVRLIRVSREHFIVNEMNFFIENIP